MVMIMMMMMIDCFCGMTDQRKKLRLIYVLNVFQLCSSDNHYTTARHLGDKLVVHILLAVNYCGKVLNLGCLRVSQLPL